MSETLFILFFALVILGPRKVPGIARQVGRFYAECNRGKESFTSQVVSEIDAIDSPAVPSTIEQPPAMQNHFVLEVRGALSERLAKIDTPKSGSISQHV
jgi:Sec-independent protein translocase protein TatA